MTSMKESKKGLSGTQQAEEDEEYCLIEKLKQAKKKILSEDLKEDKEEKKLGVVVGLGNKSGSVGRAVGMLKTKLIYDFVITPSTSAALSTSVALNPYQDNTFSEHLRYLFQEVKMDSAQVQLDFHKYENLVGESGVLPAMVWAWLPTAQLTTQAYADVSNYTTARPIRWSQAKPNVTYTVPAKWFKGQSWSASQEATVVYSFLTRWAPCRIFETTAQSMGFVHIATQDASGVASRPIIGRLIMYCTFRNRV